jgi:hypothetical protein
MEIRVAFYETKRPGKTWLRVTEHHPIYQYTACCPLEFASETF